jgi:benzoyl-CoA reductase/2-hydroxyglutaryl-CoA dehydratase subunit BcrC/BadD/HgdB
MTPISRKLDLNEVLNNLIEFKRDGKKIVGIIPHSIVPDEIIHASNSIPLHFCLGGTEDLMKAASYLPETICAFQRVNLGIFEGKDSISYKIYNLIDFVVAGTFCPGIQNTGMYLEHYFGKDQYRLIIPFSSKQNPFNYFVKELLQFEKFLEMKTHNAISGEKLAESITLYNNIRKIYQEMDEFRRDALSPVRFSDIQRLIHHLYLNGPELNLKEVLNALEVAKNGHASPDKKGVPVFLSGNGILFDDAFVDLLESCACHVVGDDVFTGSEFYSSVVDLDSRNPEQALAERHLCKNLSGRMIPEDYRTKNVIEFCRKNNIKGIINNCLKFCDSYSSNADLFKRRMTEEGFQVLNLERDYSQNSIGQLKTRIDAFLEIVKG